MYKICFDDIDITIRTAAMFPYAKQLHAVMDVNNVKFTDLIGELYVILSGTSPDLYNGSTVIVLQDFVTILDKNISLLDMGSKQRILLLAHMVCFYSKVFCSPDARKPVSPNRLWDMDKDVYVQLVERAQQLLQDPNQYKITYWDQPQDQVESTTDGEQPKK